MPSETNIASAKPDRLLTTLQCLLELSTTDVVETIQRAAPLITQTLGVEKIDVFLYDAESQCLVAQGTSTTPVGNKEKAIGLDRLLLANGGRIVEVYLIGQSYWTGQAHRDPHELGRMTEELGIKSEMAVPLEVNAERRGVLFASSSRPDFLTEQDLRFLEAVGHWIGSVIHRAELMEQQTKDARARADAMSHMVAIVSSSDDAIISKDLSGTILSWNPAAERMYGYSEQQMVGRSITLLFPPDRQQEFAQIMERIGRGERVDHYETIRARKDGSLLHVSVTISPIRDTRDIIIGASTIARDISGRIELERQREAFIGLATHELKNPLAALQGNVQLIQRQLQRRLNQAEELPEEEQRWLEGTITRLAHTRQLLRVQQRLINDLLDLVHIHEDKVKLHLSVFDLIWLVDETVQDYQTVHPNRFIMLDLPEQGAIPVYADRDRVQQVLGNYLTNALKFAPSTETIQVGIAREGAKVRVWVQDRGPGLTQEQQTNIWKRLYQVTHTPVQSGFREGLGLGLYLCQQLIQRQQGSVGVESIPGEGATFWFTLQVSEK